MSPRERGGPPPLPEFDWDEHNEVKLVAHHNVSALEAEQCFANRNTRRRVGDDYLLLGRTDGGRMLLLIYEQKVDGRVRVYSAREMTDNERRTFRRIAQ